MCHAVLQVFGWCMLKERFCCGIQFLFSFQCDPIEDPVQWMVLGEAFVNDEKKVLSKVCFNIQVPRRVVHIPCDISSSGFSPCLVLFWVEC